MCGIIGVASSAGWKDHTKRRDFLHNGLYADALRGFHSTGLLAVPANQNEEIIIHKKAMPAHDFLETRPVGKILTNVDKYHYVVGHNRHATKGSISSKMAHPFQYGDISLVHNGTLVTQGYLPDGLKFTSDSEAITNAINEQGSEETIKELDGAFALVWHDDSDHTLHMVRNEERPLSFAFVKDEDTMLFASEKRMLDWIAIRNGLKMETVYNLNEGYEIIFSVGQLRDFKSIKHKLRVKPVYQGYYNNGYNNNRGGTNASSNRNANGTQSKGASVHTLPSKKQEIFKKFNLEPGEEYEIEVQKFIPFNSGQTSGTVYGYLQGKLKGRVSPHEIRITGLREDEWSWLCESEGADDIRYARASLTQSCNVSGNYPTFTAINPEISDLNTFMQAGDNDTDKDDDVPFEDVFKGPGGTMITRATMEKYLEHGCANCSCDIEPEDADTLKWTADSRPVCSTCQGDETLGITLH